MKIKIDDIELNYIVSGQGKDIVLLHGWGGSIKSFQAVHEYLKDYFRVFTIDFPGFGESSEPNEIWGVEEYSDIFCKFVSKLNINDPIIMAHSFGGRVAIYSANKINYNKLILVDSAGIKPKRSLKYYVKIYTYKFIKNIAKLPLFNKILMPKLDAYRKKVGSSDYNDASIVMRGILSKVVNQDLKKYLPNIKVPTLLIWGANDTATPLSDAKIMEKYIQDAGLVVFEEAGHFSYIEEYNRFIRVIDSFLKDDMEANYGD